MTATADAPIPTEQRPVATSPKTSGQALWPAALAGAVASVVALGFSEFLAGLIQPIPSLLLAIGTGVIDLGAGSRLKEIAIALFGTNEKSALVIGTVILAVGFGAALGLAVRRASLVVAAVGFVLFGAVGVLATVVSPLDSTLWATVSAALSVALGIAALRYLMGLDDRVRAVLSRGTNAARGRRGRRDFIRVALGMAAIGGVLGALGRSLSARSQTSALIASVVLPEAEPAASVPPGTSFESIDGLSPLFTPNQDFYRIDTALMAPVVDVQTWSLRIHGMVDQEVELTYDDLLAMDQFEADVTIACVSNEVGGDLIGNARWQGVRLSEVLDAAGVQSGAGQIVGRSVDGWTGGFPTEFAFDGRDAMIAVAMNGEPLPVDHGFPARLIIPGVYGYVSATKWLQDIELTTWEAFDGYWIPRGWSKEGPIKTQSRIDVPRRGQSLSAGGNVVAGVAWAQHRGVAGVEVSIDDGPWQQAELAKELNIDTWRQWRFEWDATPGDHRIRVRATDADGMTQSETPVPVAPNGAEGYHTRVVRIG
ncbi:MAG: molybdopterin-dependent oxidoreductase [Euzebya sp.]